MSSIRAKQSGGGGGGNRKKTQKKKVAKTQTDFIEREDSKTAMFERAQAATRRNSNDASSSSSVDDGDLGGSGESSSFEAKLKRVQEEGKMKAKMTGGVQHTKDSTPSGITPISQLAPTFGGERTVSNNNGEEDEDVFKSPIVRIGSLLAAIALAIVVVPTDLTFNAIGSKQVQEKYRKEALEDIEKQKEELNKVLESTPNDPELLKQQAKNFWRWTITRARCR